MFAEENRFERLQACGDPTAHEDCGLRLVLDRLGEKWTVMTVAELASSQRRYRELERSLVGITQRMLTLTLRRLERDGLVDRIVEATNPPSVTYLLTARGQSFAKIVVGLVGWSRLQKQAIEASQRDFDRRHAGHIS